MSMNSAERVTHELVLRRALLWDFAVAVACIDLLVGERSRPLILDGSGIQVSLMDLSDHSADCVADVMMTAYERRLI